MAAEEPLQKQPVSPPAATEEEPQPEQERQEPEPGENVEEQQLETPQEKEPQPEGEEAKQDSEQPEAGKEERRDAGGEEGEKEQGGAETAGEARVNEPELVREPEPTDQEKEQVLPLQQRSREGSQAKEEEEEEEEKVEEAEDEEEEQIRGTAERSELVLLYMTFCTERDKLQHQSMLLQHKLAAIIRRRKSLDSRRSPRPRSSGKGPTPAALVETEQRYLRILEVLSQLRAQYINDTAQCKQQAEELAVHCHEILQRVDTDWRVFQERKKQVALVVLSRRGGRQAAAEEVEQIHAREQRKEETLVHVRLENIKLKDKVRELEQELRASEELADGLHLIDFEQLKIENQTYNEKIEERNEELLKLRRKITSTVHILAHLKEKLQFVQAENQTKKEHLAQVEAAVAYRRDILTKTKQARDSLRISNVKLRQKCGLLGNEALLRDFEEKTDASDELGHRLETLKRRHAELTLNCSGIKKKIKEVKEAREAKTALQK